MKMNLQTVSTAKRRRQSANSGQFTPTVLISESTRQALLNGDIKLKRGQWVLDGASGNRGQMRGISTKNHYHFFKPNTVEKAVDIRAYQPGRKFSDYQRAV